jgi:monooxygenase
MEPEHFDVLIVGAGLSGIGAAWHLQEECPTKTYAILEARDASGGTWDLFRYPGIRSDSDMLTLGYSFRPWEDAKAIADGPSILSYVRETATVAGIDRNIRYRHRVISAAWSSEDARWTVEVERGGLNGDEPETAELTCNFLHMCSGYYRYDEPFKPEFAGTERFRGEIVHPQEWRDDIDYTGKRVIVIGSGATAVTLVPAMAETAAHVTMLQRSPSYVVSLPGVDPVAGFLRRYLPPRVAFTILKWKNVLMTMASFQLSRRRPRWAKALIRKGVERQLPPGYDTKTHFRPKYNPWDQRMCLVPDGDLFAAISSGRATVVTDTVDTFTETGVRTGSGEEIEADLVVTATGLNLLALGGVSFSVDGEDITLPERIAYKGLMLEDIPNAAVSIGYTNASWTLKCDLTCEYVCRLINHMDEHGYDYCVPRNRDPSITPEPFIDFNSGYVQRSIDAFPKQGSRRPWRLHQNYALDILDLRHTSLDDGVMEFARSPARVTATSAP